VATTNILFDGSQGSGYCINQATIFDEKKWEKYDGERHPNRKSMNPQRNE